MSHSCARLMLILAIGLAAGCLRAADAEAGTEGDGAVGETGAEQRLEAILSAQQAIEHVQGQLVQRTVQADEPEAEPHIQHVTFAVALPDRYFLSWSPADDPGEKDMYLSDGETQWHVEQLFPNADPITDSRPADESGWGFHRISDFFAMDRAALSEDFELTLLELEPGQGVGQAEVGVHLVPKDPDVAEEIKSIDVHLDADRRTTGVVILDKEDNVTTIEVVEADYQNAPDPAFFTWSE